MTRITYVVGDATEPLQDGQANCPCILLDETCCPEVPDFCYHISGEGECSWCDRTGIVTQAMEKRWPGALANLRRVAAENKRRAYARS